MDEKSTEKGKIKQCLGGPIRSIKNSSQHSYLGHWGT